MAKKNSAKKVEVEAKDEVANVPVEVKTPEVVPENEVVDKVDDKDAESHSDETVEVETQKPAVEEDVVKESGAEKASSGDDSVATAIVEGLKGLSEESKKEKNFTFEAETGVEHRFSLVRNKAGRIMTRENETGKLTELQLLSLEEKEALEQDQEVEEL